MVSDLGGYLDDVLYVLEVANLQLEEYRVMDRKLDRYLNQAYEDLKRRRFGFFGTYSASLRTLLLFRMDIGELNELADNGYANSVNFCFPHYFILPTYGSASSYRIRPLGPEECLFELWSLTRFPDGEQRPPLKTPEPWPPNDPRWLMIISNGIR